MKKTSAQKAKRRDVRTVLLALAMFAIIVTVGVGAFLRYYYSYIDDILYRERLSQMQEVTAQLFTGLDNVVEYRWKSTKAYRAYVEHERPQTADALLAFLQEQAELNDMDAQREKLVAVDALGRYMTQDGWRGTLSDMDVLASGAEQISFVSSALAADKTYMYFLDKLKEPLVLTDGDRTMELRYIGTMQDMQELNRYFVCEAYGDTSSLYVLDADGTRLFSGTSESLIGGYNAFATIEQMEYLHGNSFAEAREALETTGRGYANAVLDGEEYYYALCRMNNASWTLLFLVPSAYVATDVVRMVNATITSIWIFALMVLSIAAFAIILILRRAQKRALETEKHANALLAEANRSLDEKNAALSAAVVQANAAQRVAESATRAKSDFLSSMSHDIRTPMNAIVGITKLMAHEKGQSEKMQSYIHKVQISSQYLLGLINDILDMSKIESNRVVLNREPVSLSDQVGQVDSIVRAQANEKQQSFVIRVHEIRHEFLTGDGVRLRQILMNLLSNAVKYTPNGGRIRLDIAEQDCETPGRAVIRFTVTDNGCGMSAAFQKHIFEPFTREHNTNTKIAQGTGLGMAITKNIVDLMGGSIAVESEPGKGSRFEVTLPLSIDRNAACVVDAKRVLLLTADAELTRNIRAAFTGISIPLTATETVTDAVAALQTEKADVILVSDPVGSSFDDAVTALRKAAPDAVLVFCVDYAQPEQVQDILERSGADDLIPRPFFLSRLVQAIEKAHSPAVQEERGSILSGMRFLCAEDNELNAEILRALLDMNGATCTIYPDGEALTRAFETVSPGDYDAILMDVQMPVMNGLDAARAVRRSENSLGKTIPIIAMTANAFSEDVQSCIDAGMDAHVPKPLDIATLERALQTCINANFRGGYKALIARNIHSRSAAAGASPDAGQPEKD